MVVRHVLYHVCYVDLLFFLFVVVDDADLSFY